VAAEIEDRVLEEALTEAAEIFADGGIRFRFRVSRHEPVSRPAVEIVVESRPATFQVHGCSRGRHDHRLGTTHLGSRRITLWSEQIARAVSGSWDRPDVRDVNDRVYARALGRVLAHELGHLFLCLNGHRDGGLMRPAFAHQALIAGGNRAFRLSQTDLAAIRSTLERLLVPSRAE
jgi:G:T-mismatch repair DNA endonuclease (very short patch repair protein)